MHIFTKKRYKLSWFIPIFALGMNSDFYYYHILKLIP